MLLLSIKFNIFYQNTSQAPPASVTLDLAFTPTTLNDGSVSEYGFGWSVSDRLGHRAVHHVGSWVGFRAAIARFVDDGLTVVVVSNASADAGEFANEMAELFLPK